MNSTNLYEKPAVNLYQLWIGLFILSFVHPIFSRVRSMLYLLSKTTYHSTITPSRRFYTRLGGIGSIIS